MRKPVPVRPRTQANIEKLAALKEQSEIDETNPFEVACWNAFERFFWNVVPDPSVLGLTRKLTMHAACCATYTKLEQAPTMELLEQLNSQLDLYLADNE